MSFGSKPVMAVLPNTFNSTDERDAHGADRGSTGRTRHQWHDGRIGTIDPTFPRLTVWGAQG